MNDTVVPSNTLFFMKAVKWYVCIKLPVKTIILQKTIIIIIIIIIIIKIITLFKCQEE